MKTEAALLTPESVYTEFAIPVSRLCARMIRDHDEAEDAAQEAWCEIMKALPSFEGRSAPLTWIWTIVRRAVFRHMKKEKLYSTRFLREFFSSHADDGLDEMDRIPVEDRQAWVRLQCSECLTAILHCVSHEDRFVYLVRRLGDLPFAEISAVVGQSEAASRQSYSRSARKISRFLSGECSLYNPNGTCKCKLREPRKKLDPAGEREREQVRSLSRRISFLDRADRWYGHSTDYWKKMYENSQALSQSS